MNYVPLWIKTDYSILSSLIKIDDLISKLTSLNIKTCAVCDDNLFYAMEFINKCKDNNIKPIIGLELKFDFTVLLYAKNYEGYQALCNLDTLKNKNELKYEDIYNYVDNLLIVIPYECMDNAKEFISNIKDYYIGYSNESEKELINDKKVFIKKYLTLKKEDVKYLSYLYKIKEEEYTGVLDCYFNTEISEEDKKTTLEFEDLCDVVIPKDTSLLPIYSKDNDFDSYKYLTDLCVYGLKKRLNNNVSSTYAERLKYELNVINDMGFCNYFLVVWDYVKYAKKNNIIVGPGRGSAASSLVSYSLGITDIDPLKYNLLFERFLNPERITMPDIDIDFDAERREEVIDYVREKYGNDKVCEIITFSNLLAKQVIRDVGRILEISIEKIDNLVRNFDDNKSLKEQLNKKDVKDIVLKDDEIKKLYDIAIHLEGLKRHTSTHAAGIVISDKKLSNYVPLLTDINGVNICGYTMNYIEDLGLLKMDFLGLKNLTIIDKVLNKLNIKFNDIPLDDRKTFELFEKGNLEGIFQFESNGMKKFIIDLKPNNIDDLIAAVALFRPGPIDNIPSFINRKYGKEKIDYINDDIQNILKETYGIIVYQEQIMQIASTMAGFSYGKADILRRAMSKKKEDVLLKQKEDFIKGSIKNGYDEKTAIDVYDLILKFANYGFNKAHSVCYAIIGYKIAYLKVHYPKEFMCELLNNYIGVSNKTKNIINECKLLNISITKPFINKCNSKYEVIDGKLVYPLSLIKKIGTLTSNQIINERNENGLYKSYYDFVRRNYKIGKSVISSIILAGLLDDFKYTRKTLIENLDEVLNYAELCNDLGESLVAKPELKLYEEYKDDELTKQELDLYGFYISNHPTNTYINDNSVTTNNLSKYFDKTVDMILYLEKRSEITTKKNEKMMFISASDIYGNIDLVMFPKVYNEYFNIYIPGVYKVTGKVEKRFSKLQLVVSRLEKINIEK